MIVNGFSKYTFENNSVFVERGYPLKPIPGKYIRFFMSDDNGNAHVMSIKNIQALLKEEPKTPSATPESSPEDGVLKRSRSKRVLHKSSGIMYESLKAAYEAFGITPNKLKSSDEFIIS
ncbi:hypothetical protein ATCVGM07011_797R [Acanthocystis turfacea Chlorella virus GM0701.1]|nr:hypothetical protein ATCVGM07011_797R [Acanthocystis turfacea Chlorella virus GM0701.1]